MNNITETLARFEQEFVYKKINLPQSPILHDLENFQINQFKAFIRSALEQSYQQGKQDGAKEITEQIINELEYTTAFAGRGLEEFIRTKFLKQ